MDEQLKQRMVGAMVLIALSIIFLPSFFQREERVVISTATEIPLAPVVEPVLVPPPRQPTATTLPSQSSVARLELFQPEVADDKVGDTRPARSASTTEIQQPSLTASGVPKAWVVQVGSFKSKEGADKLLEKLLKSDFKAYAKPITTQQGAFIRVFVGPYIDQKLAFDAKKAVDRTYQLNSQVLRFNPVSGQ